MRLLPVLGVTVALVAGVSASSATVARPVPVTVAFWDAQRGIAALSTYASCGTRSSGERVEIKRTVDGGRTWARGREVCASSDNFITAGPAIALLPAPSGMLRTADAGESWTHVPAAAVRSLAFLTPSVGWGVTGGLKSLTLQTTHDGGRTWRRLGHPCNAEGVMLSFVSRSHGWLLCLGEGGAGNQGKAVYETHDGGVSWKLRAQAAFGTRPIGRLDSYGYPTELVFRPNGRGWIPQARGATLTSADGGMTWTPLSITVPEVKIGLSVSFVSDATGFVLVQNGAHDRYELERTDDGGRTWRVVHAWRMR